MQKLISLILFSSLLIACDGATNVSEQGSSSVQKISNVDSFHMRNEEIRQDIINALLAEEIEHWKNEDGSIGFYAEDTDRVDAIGFFAIGAYAARQ